MSEPPTNPERIAYLSLVVASAIAIGVLFFLFQQQRTSLHNQVARVAALAVQANRALCLRKNEERSSIVEGRFYLKHPAALASIPRALIVKAVRDDEEVLATLTDVTCPPTLK